MDGNADRIQRPPPLLYFLCESACESVGEGKPWIVLIHLQMLHPMVGLDLCMSISTPLINIHSTLGSMTMNLLLSM